MAMNPASTTPLLRLVGLVESDPTPGDHKLITSGFARLPREVRHTGGVTRLVGYESLPNAGAHAPVTSQMMRQTANEPQRQTAQRPRVPEGEQDGRRQARHVPHVRFFGIEVEAIEDIPPGIRRRAGRDSNVDMVEP